MISVNGDESFRPSTSLRRPEQPYNVNVMSRTVDWPSEPDGGIGDVPSEDERPNSGLREGDVTHADVNQAIKYAPKTVIFGQQTRLRLGLMMEDETLPRFHAGHDLVKFFYGAIRQIPETILDGILASGITITLVQKRELLVFRDVRSHQSFHTGRTRRVIYMPEHVVESAFKAGYDYWALAEVIVKEAYPLLDYILILEFIRRMQMRMRQLTTLPGITYIKDTLRSLNGHLKDPTQRLRDEGRFMVDPKEDEFGEFYGHYSGHFKAWGRSLIKRDPYAVADEVFDEATERKWAEWKVDHITHTYSFPTFFELNRDIVHPAAYEQAARLSMDTEPTTVEEILHDLGDLARFRVSRQVKTEPLLDQLIDMGAPGILGFARLVATERALGEPVVTDYLFDGYNPVTRFREKLQAFSSDLPPDLGVGGTFDRLVNPLVVAEAKARLEYYRELGDLDGGDWRHFLRNFVFQLIGSLLPYVSDVEKDNMLATPNYYTPSQEVAAWLKVADDLFPDTGGGTTDTTLVEILLELRRHPQYHGLFEEQARQLDKAADFGHDLRAQVLALSKLIPVPPYRYSSEPHAVESRVKALRRLQDDDPDSLQQFALITEIFVRLDRADDYEQLLQHVGPFVATNDAVGPQIRGSLAELILSIDDNDSRRQSIREAAKRLLVASQAS